MSLFPGALIRRQRIRQNWSQEGLCSGICAVSYLSKIEQGKVQAGEDILLPLLERLGVRYETDPDFLARAGALIDRLYEDVYDGLSLVDSAPVEGRLAELKEEREQLLASPYMLDVLLLEGLLLWRTPDAALGEFVSCMTGRQYELHLLLSLLGGNDRAGEELLRLNPCGFFTCQVGVRRYWEGRNMESAELLGRAYLLAAQEGRAHLMLIAKVYLGNCCCDTGWLELMEEHYRAARKLGQALGDQGALLSDIDYNEATSYLEWGMAEKGLAMLEGLERDDALYFHKLAIALEKTGRREEALEATYDELENDLLLQRRALDGGYAGPGGVPAAAPRLPPGRDLRPHGGGSLCPHPPGADHGQRPVPPALHAGGPGGGASLPGRLPPAGGVFRAGAENWTLRPN